MMWDIIEHVARAQPTPATYSSKLTNLTPKQGERRYILWQRAQAVRTIIEN
jgi:hypothetical protein